MALHVKKHGHEILCGCKAQHFSVVSYNSSHEPHVFVNAFLRSGREQGTCLDPSLLLRGKRSLTSFFCLHRDRSSSPPYRSAPTAPINLQPLRLPACPRGRRHCGQGTRRVPGNAHVPRKKNHRKEHLLTSLLVVGFSVCEGVTSVSLQRQCSLAKKCFFRKVAILQRT